MLSKLVMRRIVAALFILGTLSVFTNVQARHIQGQTYTLEKNKATVLPFTNKVVQTSRALPACPPAPPIATTGNVVTQNPNALPGAFFPASATNALAAPAQTAISTFIAGDSGINPQYVGTPPDTMGVIAPQQFIMGLTNGIVSFTRQGVRDNVLDAEFASFLNLDGDFSIFASLSNPNLRYFAADDRVYLIGLNVDAGIGSTQLNNGFTIAVSDTGTISTATKWTVLTILNATIIPDANGCPGDQNLFFDYPSLGIDSNALYTSFNMFDVNGNYLTTTAFVIQKQSLLGAGPVNVTVFRDVVGDVGDSYPLRQATCTLTGVVNYDLNPTFGYFIANDPTFWGLLNIYRVINPGTTTPTLSLVVDVNVPATASTAIPSAPFSSNLFANLGVLEVPDDRISTPVIRNGQLFGVQNILVDQTGVGNPAGDRTAARWFQLRMNGGGIETATTVPTLTQAGTWYDSITPAGFGPVWVLFPSIMVNINGDLVIGATVTSANIIASGSYAGRLATDAAGSLRIGSSTAGAIFAPGVGTYSRILGQGVPQQNVGQRWGDYSYTSLDPSDNVTFWTIQERIFHGLEQVVVAQLAS